MRDLSTEQERQVTRGPGDQVKILDVPSAWEGTEKKPVKALPRVGRIELGEGVIVPQVVSAEDALKCTSSAPVTPPTSSRRQNEVEQSEEVLQEASGERAHAQASPKEEEARPRYSLGKSPNDLHFKQEREDAVALIIRRGRL